MRRLLPTHFFLRWCLLLHRRQKLCKNGHDYLRVLDLRLPTFVSFFHEGETNHLPKSFPPCVRFYHGNECDLYRVLNGFNYDPHTCFWDFICIFELQIHFHRKENQKHRSFRQLSSLFVYFLLNQNNILSILAVPRRDFRCEYLARFGLIKKNEWRHNANVFNYDAPFEFLLVPIDHIRYNKSYQRKEGKVWQLPKVSEHRLTFHSLNIENKYLMTKSVEFSQLKTSDQQQLSKNIKWI